MNLKFILRINEKILISRHAIIKLLKTKHIHKNLDNSQRKYQLTPKGPLTLNI